MVAMPGMRAFDQRYQSLATKNAANPACGGDPLSDMLCLAGLKEVVERGVGREGLGLLGELDLGEVCGDTASTSEGRSDSFLGQPSARPLSR